MPLQKLITENQRAWAIWRLSETEAELLGLLANIETIPDAITNPNKRREWIGGRLLTQCLLAQFGLPYHGIVKDDFGKPYPAGHHSLQLSLSHSYPYVAAILDAGSSVGIDLEQPKEKLLRVAPRVLSVTELNNAGDNIVKHCIYWCSKEVLIKIHGRKDLVLAENILISPFSLDTEGHIIGRLIVADKQTLIPLYYQVLDQFVLVFNVLESRANNP